VPRGHCQKASGDRPSIIANARWRFVSLIAAAELSRRTLAVIVPNAWRCSSFCFTTSWCQRQRACLFD
jgi:hypothetical protein